MWRITQVAEGSGLENRQVVNAAPGFESLILRFIFALGGEVPKGLKGLPWKGSRSLTAVRGFKSHLLR